MSPDRRSGGGGPARQRLLVLIALAAVLTAWRERAFARNRVRYGSLPRRSGGERREPTAEATEVE